MVHEINKNKINSKEQTQKQRKMSKRKKGKTLNRLNDYQNVPTLMHA